jgi:hypothetical protein
MAHSRVIAMTVTVEMEGKSEHYSAESVVS